MRSLRVHPNYMLLFFGFLSSIFFEFAVECDAAAGGGCVGSVCFLFHVRLTIGLFSSQQV